MDTKYRHIWASLVAPGNRHDSSFYQSTKQWPNIVSQNVLFKTATKNSTDLVISPVIHGAGAFPMKSLS